jgi:hypothetical protein
MNLSDLTVRIKRLEQLSMNLSKEEHRVFKGELRLLFVERREYLKAIREDFAGEPQGSRQRRKRNCPRCVRPKQPPRKL